MKPAQAMVNVLLSREDFAQNDYENVIWHKAEVAHLNKLWSGAEADEKRHAFARLIWTDEALFVRFDCRQYEPLIANPRPDLEQKTIGLWERDVCEIFIAPGASEPNRYFEFEAAPTGEWLDLAICQLPERRETDWSYRSSMKTRARIEKNSFTIILRVKWQAFGKKPQTGDLWRGNLFRCVGMEEATRYLAWQPTFTEKPNFHVPDRFGWLRFSE